MADDGAKPALGEAKPSLTRSAELERAQTMEFPVLGSVDSAREEFAATLDDMREFHRSEPDMVMSTISAHTARLAEIILYARRIEVQHRQWKTVREEAEFLLSQLREQFNLASRLLTVRSLDQQMSRGQI